MERIHQVTLHAGAAHDFERQSSSLAACEIWRTNAAESNGRRLTPTPGRSQLAAGTLAPVRSALRGRQSPASHNALTSSLSRPISARGNPGICCYVGPTQE